MDESQHKNYLNEIRLTCNNLINNLYENQQDGQIEILLIQCGVCLSKLNKEKFEKYIKRNYNELGLSQRNG